jgi:hypothetical protein
MVLSGAAGVAALFCELGLLGLLYVALDFSVLK